MRTLRPTERRTPRTISVPVSLMVQAGAAERIDRVVGEVGLTGLRLLVASGAGPSRVYGDNIHRSLAEDSDRYLIRGNRREDVVAMDVYCAQQEIGGLVAVGGGRVIDVCKAVSRHRDLPVLVAPTALSSDCIASPVAVIEETHGSASLPARMPLGVVIDLELVKCCPRRMLLSGLGDLLANLSASLDWQLALETGEDRWDGFADILARQAAEQVLFLDPQTLFEREGLVRLAEGLVMSGIAMEIAGSSRPCSGAEHLVSHALDRLGVGHGSHGEQVAIGVLFVQALRERQGLPRVAQAAVTLIRRSGLPCSPEAIGVGQHEFFDALRIAPDTRPGRFTVLSMDHPEPILEEAYSRAFGATQRVQESLEAR